MSQLNKIDKLLRLHENNSDKAEADSALRKAAQLMREHLDNPESGIVVDRKRIEDLERREREVERLCRGCGSEKPNHREGCLSHQLEKRIGRASAIGCFSCAGVMFLWFLTALVNLLTRIFG